jgi:hypothetical protein
MLKQVKGYEGIITVFVNAQNAGLLLTETDWYIATRLRLFLKPFYKATVQLSGVYYPTSCLVLEWLWRIAYTFNENKDDNVLNPIVEQMKDKYLKYFSTIPHLYYFAVIFDPRKKLGGLELALQEIGDLLNLDFSDAYNHVKEEVFRVFQLYQGKFGCSPPVPKSTQQHKASKSSAANLWNKIKGKGFASSSQQTTRLSWNPIAELNHYLEQDLYTHDPMLADNNTVNLLAWWKDKERFFPVLSHFARDVLLVPVSTVSSEATFSMVGRIIEERRSSLTPEMVEAITCLKDWERANAGTQHQLEDLEIAGALADLENLDLDDNE